MSPRQTAHAYDLRPGPHLGSELSWPAVLLILAVTALVVLGALVVGQQRQQTACAEVAGIAQACSSTTYPTDPKGRP